jgi:hypothetical protein
MRSGGQALSRKDHPQDGEGARCGGTTRTRCQLDPARTGREHHPLLWPAKWPNLSVHGGREPALAPIPCTRNATKVLTVCPLFGLQACSPTGVRGLRSPSQAAPYEGRALVGPFAGSPQVLRSTATHAAGPQHRRQKEGAEVPRVTAERPCAPARREARSAARVLGPIGLSWAPRTPRLHSRLWAFAPADIAGGLTRVRPPTRRRGLEALAALADRSWRCWPSERAPWRPRSRRRG